MTENKLEKRAVRQRMAKTGEKYTVAHRALLEPEAADYELRHLVQPGNVVAIVNGGGGTNLSLALPVLARHLEDGGHLVLTRYRDDRDSIPGAPDLVVGRGIATVAEIVAWIEAKDEDALMQAVETAAPDALFFRGPTTPECLAAALELGPKPLLYVQDVQTDPPLELSGVEGRPHEYELVPENVRAIRAVVEMVGAAAIVCHCASAEDIESWEPLAAVCDYTLAIEDDYHSNPKEPPATVEVFDPAGELGSYETTIDTTFLGWRQALHR